MDGALGNPGSSNQPTAWHWGWVGFKVPPILKPFCDDSCQPRQKETTHVPIHSSMSHDNEKPVLLLAFSPKPHVSLAKQSTKSPQQRALPCCVYSLAFVPSISELAPMPTAPSRSAAQPRCQPEPASLPKPFIRNTQSQNDSSGIHYTAFSTYHLYFTAGNPSDFTE